MISRPVQIVWMHRNCRVLSTRMFGLHSCDLQTARSCKIDLELDSQWFPDPSGATVSVLLPGSPPWGLNWMGEDEAAGERRGLSRAQK